MDVFAAAPGPLYSYKIHPPFSCFAHELKEIKIKKVIRNKVLFMIEYNVSNAVMIINFV
jgi:hypothetical protein